MTIGQTLLHLVCVPIPASFGQAETGYRVLKLFGEIGPRYRERPGGYTRVLKCGFRAGDKAAMALVELVDRPVEAELVDE